MAGGLRLGIDIGTNSIGWCLLDLDNEENSKQLKGLGVAIFPQGRDPQSGTSLAVDRRIARGMRRRRDRFLRRRRDLMKTLVEHGLMPADEVARKALAGLDPYELRAKGLDRPLTPHEFGRALFHLHQRRGFRSNRKTDQGDQDAGKIKAAIGQLRAAIVAEGARTFGEFLWRRHQRRETVRARLQGEGAKSTYDFYPERALVWEEFDKLWRVQRGFQSALSDVARTSIETILFRQRDLRPVDPGKCSLQPSDARAPRALPRAQLVRIYQELANLRVVGSNFHERPLSITERDILAAKLRESGGLSFDRIRKLLKLDAANFNLEDEKRSKLLGDETAKVLRHKDRFGKAWHDLDLDRQTEIVERLLDEQNEGLLFGWLCDAIGLEESAAENVARARLPSGYSRWGRTAIDKVLPILTEAPGNEVVDPESGQIILPPIPWDRAVVQAGYHHSDRRPEVLLDKLPYYGQVLKRYTSHGSYAHHHGPEQRYGRIANPTVHIGLNQLRRLINGIIDEYGRPSEIVVELARELKLSFAEKARIQKQQAENQKRNERRRQTLAELGIEPSGEALARLRFWEELNPKEPHNRRCVYTGQPISINMLFDPSGRVQIDHVLPYKRTLDDGAANRTVAMRFANQAKGNQSPHEAFGTSPTVQGFAYSWDEILARAEQLPKNKRWRFGSQAMERFEADHDFLDRQLTDTAYLARVTRSYLCHICPADKVWVTPGRLTAMLRGRWGLNQLLWDHNLKDRRDHRHHTIDAFVTALTDHAMLNRVARAADQTRDRLIAAMPEPWNGFRDHLRDALNGVVVYHRPDHGVAGKLHEETAYGIVADPGREGDNNLVARKSFAALNENDIERIRDPQLRTELTAFISTAERSGQTLKQTLADFNKLRVSSGRPAIRRVRLLKKEADMIHVRDREGRLYKAYIPGKNHRIEIFAKSDGRWQGEVVTVFQANQPDYEPDWQRKYPDARPVMRVHKGDLLQLDLEGEMRVMRVARLNAKANRLYLAAHNETGDLQKRHNDLEDPFRWLVATYSSLKNMGARRVRVDVLGRVHATRDKP